MPNPSDFDLTSDTVTLTNSMPADQQVESISRISQGTPISGLDLDFLNRIVPSPTTGYTDIGAFQYDSVTSDAGAPPPASGVSDGGGPGGVDASVSGTSGASGGSSGSVSSQASSSTDNGKMASGSRPSSGCGCRLAGFSTASSLSGVLSSIGVWCVGVGRRRRRSSRSRPAQEPGSSDRSVAPAGAVGRSPGRRHRANDGPATRDGRRTVQSS